MGSQDFTKGGLEFFIRYHRRATPFSLAMNITNFLI